MEIVEDRDDYCEEEEEEEEKRVMMAGGEMGKHQTFPFYPSSSSPSPSSSSQYKGAAPQPNGRWGGQIYEKHQRLWNMGTFDSRDAAAKTLGFANYSPFDAMDTTGSQSHRGDGDEDGQGTGGGLRGVEREHMFDKVVTPSDVGKLNRLVIPKQHAEKYFPLDSSANEKGLLLSFEDRSGKPWRFRYSYWNSSQSYVMTKGWSRFVKEKKLDAGDIVSFERGLGELGKDRLYIDWKRRPDTGPDSSIRGVPLPHHPMSLHRSVPWGRIFFPPTVSLPVPPQTHMQQLNFDHSNYGYNVVNPAGSIFYLRSAGPHGVTALQQHGGGGGGGIGGGDASSAVPMVFDSVPVVHGKASAKRLRLFGVNLECPTGDEADNDVLSAAHPMSSLLPQPQQQPQPSPPLQLRLYGGGPLPTSAQDLPRKTRQSLSFDLDI